MHFADVQGETKTGSSLRAPIGGSERRQKDPAALAWARQQNIALYAELARLTDAEAVGFQGRRPGDPDVTFAVIERAIDAAPDRARALLRQVVQNDREVVRLHRRWRPRQPD